MSSSFSAITTLYSSSPDQSSQSSNLTAVTDPPPAYYDLDQAEEELSPAYPIKNGTPSPVQTRRPSQKHDRSLYDFLYYRLALEQEERRSPTPVVCEPNLQRTNTSYSV